MLFSLVFVYTEPRSANQNPRRSIFPTSRRPASIPTLSRDEKPARSFVAFCIKSVSQLFCNQQIPHSFSKQPGVTLQFPIWELFAGHSPERPLFSSSLFNGLRTLPSSVSRKSCICHSYENCRVCTNNSHSETLSRVVVAKRGAAIFRRPNVQTFQHSNVSILLTERWAPPAPKDAPCHEK